MVTFKTASTLFSVPADKALMALCCDAPSKTPIGCCVGAVVAVPVPPTAWVGDEAPEDDALTTGTGVLFEMTGELNPAPFVVIFVTAETAETAAPRPQPLNEQPTTGQNRTAAAAKAPRLDILNDLLLARVRGTRVNKIWRSLSRRDWHGGAVGESRAIPSLKRRSRSVKSYEETINIPGRKASVFVLRYYGKKRGEGE
ncbi:MAG TPA: hypothetical protein VFJ58_16260 [Armatimonadota bacterium]|nr:hypothetical protein [Armatimonadota bacterium]